MVQKLIALSAIAAVAIAAILMLGTLAAISTINHVSAQESSNTGNATEGANNPEPLQEMVPAMTFTPIITNQKQLANGLTEEKPAASTNEGCHLVKESGGSLVSTCPIRVENAPYTGVHPPVTAEQLGLRGFIYKINGEISPGKECSKLSPQSVRVRDGVEYTICEPPITAQQLCSRVRIDCPEMSIVAINGTYLPGMSCVPGGGVRDVIISTGSYKMCEATSPQPTQPGQIPTPYGGAAVPCRPNEPFC